MTPALATTLVVVMIAAAWWLVMFVGLLVLGHDPSGAAFGATVCTFGVGTLVALIYGISLAAIAISDGAGA